MADGLDPPILDLVEWVAREPRAYTELIDAWRTSCPRLTVWEDAVDRGLVSREGARDRRHHGACDGRGKASLAAMGARPRDAMATTARSSLRRAAATRQSIRRRRLEVYFASLA